MRVFVGEFVCGGGFAQCELEQIPECLRQEGAAMLQAIVSDLALIGDVEVSLDPRFEIAVNATRAVCIDRQQPLLTQWLATARDCDAALIVAPETDGVLAESVAAFRNAGINVIAASEEFIRTASDKLLTAKRLHANEVPHPPYKTVHDDRFSDQLANYREFVVKPRDGCGSQALAVFDSLAKANAELTDCSILQPWIKGRPVSVTLVVSETTQACLPAVSQRLCSETGTYLGGCGPLDHDLQDRASQLAARAVAAMPPQARGFVGIDLVLGDSPSDDCVIEINPRMTTSYVGLRKMIRGNLAARLFDLENFPVSCCQRVESVRWTPDGNIWLQDQLVHETLAAQS